MKVALLLWLAVTLLAIALALSWGYFGRPRLHRTPAPGAQPRATQSCPTCGHIPYFEAPECTRCGGAGFISITEETQHG